MIVQNKMLIAELYRTDYITFKEARNLLGESSWRETAAILEKHGCELYYDRDDFEQDLEILGATNTSDITRKSLFQICPLKY